MTVLKEHPDLSLIWVNVRAFGWGRSDLPVAIDWPCDMIKALEIFIGFGDLDAGNCNPRINAVSKRLTSWKVHLLSYRGRAIVINTLAPLHICPVGYSRNLIVLYFNSFGVVKET